MLGVSPQNTFVNVANLIETEATPETASIEFKVLGRNISDIAKQMKTSLPVMKKNLYGEVKLEFRPEPEDTVPTLTIVEHYRVNTYLGDYGADKTVKSFSLFIPCYFIFN